MSREFAEVSEQFLRYNGAPITGYPFTIAAWFYNYTTSQPHAIIGINNDSSPFFYTNCIFLFLNLPSESPRVILYIDKDGEQDEINSATAYEHNVWNHACVVVASATSRAIYLNGGGKTVSTYPIPVEFPSGLDKFRIGILGKTGELYYPMDGLISHVSIWNVALSDAEVAQLATAIPPSDVQDESLIAWWPLIDNDIDLIGDFDLTPINAPTFSPLEPFVYTPPLLPILPIFTDSLEFANIFAPEGIQLQLRSPTGEILAYLSDTDESGKILNAKITERKIGGVEKFTFQIANNTDLPITKNTECYFYVSGILRFIGQVIEIPLPDQDNPVLELIGSGFYKNLYKKVINDDYSALTLNAIITDICTNYLGAEIDIFYNAEKIQVPTISNIDIEFKDKNLFDVFSKLLQIANNDYDNAKYRFYVDNEKDFVFELMTEDLQTVLLEGYQYQTPEVSEDSANIINKILTFRTTLADSRTAQYVATYENTKSQGRYGLFEKKITFPDFIDTTTIAKIAGFILSRRSLPQTKISIKNMEVFRERKKSSDLGIMDNGSGNEDWLLDYDIDTQEQIKLITDIRRGLEEIDFGNWGISNKRNLFWEIVAECDTLNGWNLTGLNFTTAVLSAMRVLTGRQSIKFTTAAGSDSEYAEFILPTEISLAQLGRVYLYFENTVDKIRITFFDTFGNEKSIEFGTQEGTLEVDILLPDTDDMEVDYSGGTDLLDVNIINAVTFNQWLKIIQNINLLTVLDSFEVVPNGGADSFQVWTGLTQDIMDRGDCESTTPPMIKDETVPYTVGVTYARSNDFAKTGIYSYKMTKIVSGFVDAYASIFDGDLDTGNLHSLIAGRTYTFNQYYYSPSVGGAGANNYRWTFQDYDGSWGNTQTWAGSGASDTWLLATLTFNVRPGATGVRFEMYFMGIAGQNTFIYLDDYEVLEPIAEDFDIRDVTQEGILNIKKVRITILTNNAINFYLDRIDAYANIYKYHQLQLEEITYHLASRLFTADLNFGELEDNIIDEIDKKVKDGDVALAIFSKQ